MIVRKRKARKRKATQRIQTATVSSKDVTPDNPSVLSDTKLPTTTTTTITTTTITATTSTKPLPTESTIYNRNSNATVIQTSRTPKIATKFIVYIREFDKINEWGIQMCRNHNCSEPVSKPFRKYCSKKCSKQFTKWYNSNFYWRNVRNRILKRDSYTCQICGIQLDRRKRYNKSLKNWLECDHIIPKSYYYHLGYQFDTLDNKVKTILEFVHNGNNLRTLCYKCHKKQSITVVSDRTKLLDPQKGIY